MISKEELEEMYWRQGMSQIDISKEAGVSHVTVCRWMKMCGIEPRTNSESKLVNSLKPSDEKLRDMYWEQRMSQLEIADENGVGHATVCRWMKVCEIKTRTKSESKLVNSLKPPDEKLWDMYWEQGMSQLEIAEEIGVSDGAVCSWMKSCGINLRTFSESKLGERHSNWQGGISFEPYCYKFNNKFKESVRKRDDYICQLCGSEQNGRKLDVHHIHYDKENCYPDVVALCRSCHASVNINRDYWEEYFEDQLIIRGLLNWSISQSLS